MRWLLLLLVSASLAAQTTTAAPLSPCKDHSVDEYIKELNKRTRNKNPLPSTVCILGYCRGTGVKDTTTPPTFPEPAPTSDVQVEPRPGTNESSSKNTNVVVVPADVADGYNPIAAAKNVDVADQEFESKNYRAALSRYQDAAEEKWGDAAIYVRLARTYEKLSDAVDASATCSSALRLQIAEKARSECEQIQKRVQPQLSGKQDEITAAEKDLAAHDRCLAPAAPQP